MPTYISDLSSTNPQNTDPVSGGDDVLREIQLALLTTFPNVTGAVNTTQTEMNYLDGITGVTGSGNLVASAAPTLTGAVTMTGSLAVTGAITGSIAADQVDSLTFADARIAASNVTQHEAAITITKSQVSDFGSPLYSGDTATTLSIGNADTTLSRDAAGQLAVEGDAVLTHNDGTYTSGKVFFSNGTEPTVEGSDGDIFLVY